MGCGNVYGDTARCFDMKCAWCGRVIGGSNIKDSHGMCEGCYRRELNSQRAAGGEPDRRADGGDFEQGGE